MKRNLLILFILASTSALCACGSPQNAQLATNFNGSTTTNALALCNQFSVGGVMMANVEHPTTGANPENYLVVDVTQLSPSFNTNPANTVTFYRQAISTSGSTTDPTPLSALLTDGTPLGSTITPAIAQGVYPLVFVLGGTDVNWNVIQVVIKTYSSGGTASVATGNFLIPAFYADPLVYQSDPSHPASLVQLHPFYKYLGQSLDFVSMANAFCFL